MSLEDFDDLLDEDAGDGALKPKGAHGARPLVLVVDDDPLTRRALKTLLSEQYRLILCSTATEAVDAFNRWVCAVVLDVKMSGRDGFWACDQIRKRQPDVPVIFYSAYQDAKDPFEIINSHRPFAYITKDGTPQRLLDVLETATRLFRSTLRSRRLVEHLRKVRTSSRPPRDIG